MYQGWSWSWCWACGTTAPLSQVVAVTAVINCRLRVGRLRVGLHWNNNFTDRWRRGIVGLREWVQVTKGSDASEVQYRDVTATVTVSASRSRFRLYLPLLIVVGFLRHRVQWDLGQS